MVEKCIYSTHFYEQYLGLVDLFALIWADFDKYWSNLSILWHLCHLWAF